MAAAPPAPDRPLAELDDDDRTRSVLGETIRFATGFLRWLDGSTDSALTFPRVRVLEQLRRHGPMIMRDLADGLSLSARNITAIVDALEEQGQVVRRPHPHDRRATVVDLTDAGRTSADRASAQALRRVADAFAVLDVDEQQQFVDLLGRLRPGLGSC